MKKIYTVSTTRWPIVPLKHKETRKIPKGGDAWSESGRSRRAGCVEHCCSLNVPCWLAEIEGGREGDPIGNNHTCIRSSSMAKRKLRWAKAGLFAESGALHKLFLRRLCISRTAAENIGMQGTSASNAAMASPELHRTAARESLNKGPGVCQSGTRVNWDGWGERHKVDSLPSRGCIKQRQRGERPKMGSMRRDPPGERRQD